MAQKVALAATVAILTYYPEIEDDLSAGRVICTALVDRISSDYSVLNVKIFLSIGWLRNILKKRCDVSFQRTVKGLDRRDGATQPI